MADFTQNTNVKSAVRKLANPIADIDCVQHDCPERDPEQPVRVCIAYESGVNHPPVEKSRESYTAKFVYQNGDAKTVGRRAESYDTVTGYTAGIAAVLANSANNTAQAAPRFTMPQATASRRP